MSRAKLCDGQPSEPSWRPVRFPTKATRIRSRPKMSHKFVCTAAILAKHRRSGLFLVLLAAQSVDSGVAQLNDRVRPAGAFGSWGIRHDVWDGI